MTPGQRRRANALIRATCCNYDNGNCLLLDDAEECACVQSISYSVCCTWFRRAVLPLDKPLETELFYRGNRKRCAVCGMLSFLDLIGRNTVKPVPERYTGNRRTPAAGKGGGKRTIRG
ncbi:cysteine-rich VLP domain-containing protein [Caldifermentibacillus hisashii]|uniref:cysteine-rich VLP domain-containing protein n=1 Tax=Caldifermentibacillus hisashii TaxID=996558 RepID=UPI003CCEC728